MFWDPNTLEGQQEWLLPFGWEVTFPMRVELDPGTSTTKILTVKVPTSEDPGAFVIYLKGWSEGEPIKSVDKGTYDILELGVYVSIRSSGNIVFEATDSEAFVQAGDPNDSCHEYEVPVTKNYDSGDLVFTLPGAPESRPSDVDVNTWRQDNWDVSVDFRDAPGTNDPLEQSRPWTIPPGQDYVRHTVYVEVCAPDNAKAGIGPTIILKAYLDGYPKISDFIKLDTTVIHEFSLSASTNLSTDRIISVEGANGGTVSAYSVYPGEKITLPTTITNDGNGPDRYDYRLATVIDPSGVPVKNGHWDIIIPRDSLQELSRDTSQTFDVLMNVPETDIGAGLYTIIFQTYSEEAYPDSQGRSTKLRDVQTMMVYVNEFYDMEIVMDPRVDNPIKTSAPGKIVSFTVNITNNGNVEDWPTLANHTSSLQGNDRIWETLPGMGQLSGWSVEWRTVKQIGNDLTTDEACIPGFSPMPSETSEEYSTWQAALEEQQNGERCAVTIDGTYIMPKMAPYQTIEMVAVVKISTEAKLDTRYVGLKVVSKAGDMTEGGDFDSSPSWQGDLLDSNELILQLRLRAPDLVIKEIINPSSFSGDIDSTIPIGIILQNTGNTHATDIEIVLCQYDDANEQDIIDEIERNGCAEDSIVMRQVVGALLAPDASEDAQEVEIYLLYPVVAGSKGIYVVVDPMNEIVEAKENNNIKAVSEPLESPSPFLDVAGQIVGKTALPFVVILLTLSLLGVVYFVGKGRREEVNKRLSEQSSLISVLESKE